MDDSPNQDASNQENLEVTKPLGCGIQVFKGARLLNSLLLSLFWWFFFWVLWNIVVWVAPAGEAFGFADAGTPSSAPSRAKIRLIKQNQPSPPVPLLFKQAISDISC